MTDRMKQYRYLFLDRDGVINVERPDDYVKSVREFVFEENASDAVAILSTLFDKIFVITNQRGVGRGVMTEDALQAVHSHMLSEIAAGGGKISQIYYCTDNDSTSINRKPNVGMAFRALEDYPEIVFAESIMVGNSKSDILFGKKLGMYTVLVGDKYPRDNDIYTIADAHYENLYKFALSLKNQE